MSSSPDPAKLKVVELRAELSKRGLDTKGIKSALVKRLKDALEDELNQELPDTSIADTSTEDLDSSQEPISGVEEKVPDKDREKESADQPPEGDGGGEEECKKVEANADQTEVENNETTGKEAVEKMETDEVESSENVDKEIVNTETPLETAENKESESKKDEEIEEKSDTKVAVENGQTGQEEEDHSKVVVENVETKDNQDTDETQQQKDESTGDGKTEDSSPKGEKRKRSSPSPDRAQRKRSKSPIKEDEPPIDNDKVQLSWYDSDLHLLLDKESFLSAKPYHEGAFGFAWAGVRATHGVNTGKVCYEVKITEELKWDDFSRYYERNRHRDQSKSHTNNNNNDNNNKDNDKKKTVNDNDNHDDDNDHKETKQSENGEEQPPQEPEEKPSKEPELEANKDEEQTAESSADAEKPMMDVDENPTETDKTENEAKDEEMIEDKSEPTPQQQQEQQEEEEEQKSETSKSNTNREIDEQNETIPTHLFRVGWSILSADLQLGEDKYSYGYESTGKFVNEKQFNDYGRKFGVGDVIMSFLVINDEFVSITYAVNGELQPEAIKVERTELPENFVLFPHVLSRNYAFELNLGSKDVPWYPKPARDLFDDYQFLDKIDNKICGPIRPESRSECEVILMCGLPASGKTHWIKEYVQTNPDKKYTILGNSQLLEKMTVDGDALKNKFKGRWNVLLDKLQKCLNKLIEIASLRRRNYIIDQPNVFPSAQRRKLRPFEGFKRRAVVVVVGDEEQAKRQNLQEAQRGGKDVPDSSVLEMKANMSLPVKCDWIDDVIYAGLDEAEAKVQVQKYNTQGREAGYGFQKRFSHRDDRHRWQNRRNDYRSANYRDRNYRGGRYDRSGPPLPPPPPPPSSRHNWHSSQRSGGGGGGGWNRDRRDRRGPPPMGRDWRNNRSGGRDRNRDNHGGYNRNRNSSRSSGGGSWQSSSGGNNWNNQPQQGWNNPAWGGGSNQGSWSSNSNQPNSGWSQNNQWKYGGGGGSGQSYGGYSNWNYYNQYPQSWSTQDQTTGSGNQYGGGPYSQQDWAQYAQHYAQQGQTTSTTTANTGASSSTAPK